MPKIFIKTVKWTLAAFRYCMVEVAMNTDRFPTVLEYSLLPTVIDHELLMYI